MRFTTRMTLLFGLVSAVFVVSTLPVTAGLLRGAVQPSRLPAAEWDKVTTLWAEFDEQTKEKTAPLMDAISDWKTASSSPSLDADARYLRFQTGFLMFATFQALVLFVLVAVGLRVLMAPVRNMTRVVERLKTGDLSARLTEGGGTEWKALARQFNTMLDQNQTLSRLQGWQEVSAFLSHQIKNPLTSIGFAEQNLRSLVPDLSDQARQNLDIIADQGRRINNLVRRLRDLTSFSQMGQEQVPLGPWLAAWARGRQREGELWEVSTPDVGLAPLVVLLWEQALDNLLANSREACRRDTLSLRLTLRREGRLLVLEWCDDNTLDEGTPLHLIGTARYTTKKEGSGLGVFFVRRIAELHGGSLTIGPSSTGGLTFILSLEGGPLGPHPRRR